MVNPSCGGKLWRMGLCKLCALRCPFGKAVGLQCGFSLHRTRIRSSSRWQESPSELRVEAWNGVWPELISAGFRRFRRSRKASWQPLSKPTITLVRSILNLLSSAHNKPQFLLSRLYNGGVLYSAEFTLSEAEGLAHHDSSLRRDYEAKKRGCYDHRQSLVGSSCSSVSFDRFQRSLLHAPALIPTFSALPGR